MYSCKKEQQADAFNETFPTYFKGKEWRYLTPYCRAFTNNGEIKDSKVINDFMLARRLHQFYRFVETAPLLAEPRINFISPDSVIIHQLENIYGVASLQSNGRERLLTLKGTIETPTYSSRYAFEKALVKHGEVSEYVDYGGSGIKKHIPVFYAYRTAETLEMPYITYNLHFVAAVTIRGQFNENVYKALAPGDTLIVQNSLLVFKMF